LARDEISPAALTFLAAVGALTLRWGTPLSSFYSTAIFADVLIAAAALLFMREVLSGRLRFAWRPWHIGLGAYLAWVAIAALAAPDRAESLKTFLLVTELAAFAVIAACLAERPAVARALARVTLAGVLLTLALTLTALTLFYAGHDTGLLGRYGDLAESSSYARVRAGFASAPLLASWCIAASAILAWSRGELPRAWRLAGQFGLAVIVVATLSRPILIFGLALMFRWAVASRRPAAKVATAAAAIGVVAVLALLTVGDLRTKPLSYDLPGPRSEAASSAWDTLRGDPLFGIGPGTDPGFYMGQRVRAHLTPLNIAASAGLPALLALVGAAVALWRGRLRPTDIAIWSGLAALMVDGLTQDVEHFRHVWLLIGLAAVARTTGREVVSNE
jgi:hypothetical protein